MPCYNRKEFLVINSTSACPLAWRYKKCITPRLNQNLQWLSISLSLFNLSFNPYSIYVSICLSIKVYMVWLNLIYSQSFRFQDTTTTKNVKMVLHFLYSRFFRVNKMQKAIIFHKTFVDSNMNEIKLCIYTLLHNIKV